MNKVAMLTLFLAAALAAASFSAFALSSTSAIVGVSGEYVGYGGWVNIAIPEVQ